MAVAILAAIRVLFLFEMEEKRRQRGMDRAMNEWFSWTDVEQGAYEGEDVWGIGGLFSREETVQRQLEHQAYMSGEQFPGEIGPDTLRARWIADLREESRQYIRGEEAAATLNDLEDHWNLRILFGEATPAVEAPEEDWDLESWD